MLKSLSIQNFVLIDRLDIRFGEAFSVITGETGAGKSIILGALGLVLGQRADARSLKAGADKCVVEAVFDISPYGLEPFFEANDLDYEASGSCLLRRELTASGKSRAFVNDSPAPLSIVKELGARLIDIHSQHQNLLLADAGFQLRSLDIMAANKEPLEKYHKDYAAWQALCKQWKALGEQAAQARRDEDYLRFQLKELDEARLEAGEQAALEAEQERLGHTEEIKTSLYKIAALLDAEETGVLGQLREALSAAEAVKTYYPAVGEMAGRLDSAYLDLKDLADEVNVRKEDVEFDPERLAWVGERLNLLYSLEQKHRLDSVEALIEERESCRARLKELDNSEEQLAAQKEACDKAKGQLLEAAESLSQGRQAAAETLAGQLTEDLARLGMPNTRFRVDFRRKEEPEAEGVDEVRFLFSANKNAPLEPVAQTASGGEISRLMLCLKAMIARFTALPAIIFDEVDTGVSGDIADKMGNIMQEMSHHMQVIAITHLPQIAAKGEEHFFVYKK
ncbi:MAG: DNA repair protein RecN, partial [Tannerella sp.]|nr:DNA repair protein RecN [Tannerella sp.]